MLSRIILLLADGLVIICLTRCLMQWARLPFDHPLARFCCQATDWLVQPLRKITPPLGKWDFACILAGFSMYYLAYLLVTLLSFPMTMGVKLLAGNLLFTVLGMLKAMAYVLLIGLLLRMFLSIKSPYSALLAALHQLFQPLTRAFPSIRFGHFDFSGSVLALLLWLWLSDILPQLTAKLNMWLLY